VIREKTLRKLEFNIILERLSEYATTPGGKERCEKLRPADHVETARGWLQDTDDALSHLSLHGDLPLGGISDIRPSLLLAKADGTLTCGDFLRIAAFLRAVERLKSVVESSERDHLSSIDVLLKSLEELPGFRERLDRSIASEDDLKDHASPDLFRIRRQLQEAKDAVRIALERVLAQKSSALQEPLVTIREGRYVVPVRSDRRQAIDGLVHDTSSTGSTLFIEPMAVVSLNNKIRELQSAEQHEIIRILRELSGIVATNASLLQENFECIGELDFFMAKACLATYQEAVRPKLNDQGVIVLYKARHPLIPKNEVVPIDFELGLSFRTLVITGPNTGGKTVTLKTCGLLTLMAMAGLMIPAASGSEISWFHTIAVDIGDEQSIEQSLSTFSSHMKELIAITNDAGPGMLALVDELGAGTDPSEGAALAIAILDHLKKAGAHTVATTHYQELKGYAMNTPDVENACCEFDIDTLQPTYHLLVGVPGVSNALSIASRLGLDQDIVENASSLISNEGAQFEHLVRSIETSHRKARKMEEDLVRLRVETEEAKEALTREREKWRVERERLRAEAQEKTVAMMEEASGDVEALLAKIREDASKSGGHRLESEARGTLHKLKRKYALSSSEATRLEQETSSYQCERIEIGEMYEAETLGVTGTARAISDDGKTVVLESGSFRVTVPASSLQRVKKDRRLDARKKRRHSARIRSATDNTADVRADVMSRASAELMLLGKRVDEALVLLDQFLDDAVLAGLTSVRIVHGKGTGALRQATQDALLRDRRVETFRLGGEGEGGDGVTIVKFCQRKSS